MNTKLRLYALYAGVFLITLSASLALTFVRSLYVNRQSVFVSAAWEGRVMTMRVVEIFGAKVDRPTCRTRNCLLPLVAAAWGGSQEAVVFLLERGADINEGGMFDRTPLMVASFCGEAEVVKLLLDRGADVNLTNGEGETALSFARRKDQRRVIRLLLQAGATE